MGRMTREGEPGGAAKPTNPAALGSPRRRRAAEGGRCPDTQVRKGATARSRPSCPMGSHFRGSAATPVQTQGPLQSGDHGLD